MTRTPVIVEAVRTPMGRHGGALSAVRPDDLAAVAIRGLLARVPALDPERITDVYFGCSNQAGEDNRNVARMAVLLAGLPDSVPGCTINRLCSSGLEAVNAAARGILAGEGDVFLAGGVESMSRAPWVFPKNEKAFGFGNVTAYDTALGWRFPNPKLAERFPLEAMGETAENVAERYAIAREEQDAFALSSHQKAARASDSVFSEEIVPVEIPQRKGPSVVVSKDETFRRDTDPAQLSALKPAFRKGGSVTAGNSSSLNDGASALLVMEAKAAEAAGLKPMAVWRGAASAGVDPRFMGLGPVYASRKLMERLSLTISDFDLYEINEAFAAQSLVCVKELEIDPVKLNVNGGAIALGHPLGCSGARITTTLLHEMRRRKAKRGLASLCIGVGQGLSAVFEAA
ncbi:MAG: beta-ketoadipyl CoA thiolase [Elusimicrobia bacterium CG1_02_63_36]|nr:MAG: beta-ketoadipyl CoA thiolase [Elusimicrobia bacterium CG1_02_63_36]PIP81480.1 MAG: acetyl-CoA C-acyltransferase [Elusimicrobia bacterium CG22_combo_CG10-13_8_21_14_all_63_91]PJA17073.1 MAG: acetyl-CoA C-acyltransferase [Elusimicrobia bacterium CG_4_10_14_0_2_um_filter_63_34]PJB25760.1 MAG: acetyl-CoA C-acyltransferase [Elusimicrobia bacterium CG_4_9_14_3_um_filter_62_55]